MKKDTFLLYKIEKNDSGSPIIVSFWIHFVFFYSILVRALVYAA